MVLNCPVSGSASRDLPTTSGSIHPPLCTLPALLLPLPSFSASFIESRLSSLSLFSAAVGSAPVSAEVDSSASRARALTCSRLCSCEKSIALFGLRVRRVPAVATGPVCSSLLADPCCCRSSCRRYPISSRRQSSAGQWRLHSSSFVYSSVVHTEQCSHRIGLEWNDKRAVMHCA